MTFIIRLFMALALSSQCLDMKLWSLLKGETPQLHFNGPFGDPIDTTPPGAPPPDPDPDATLARFTRPDPQRDGSWLAPHTLNLYAYVGNDPMNRWDPLGLEWYYLDSRDENGNVVGQEWQYLEDTPEITVIEQIYNKSGVLIDTIEKTVTGATQLLQFNGNTLTWFHNNGDTSSFPAISGRPDKVFDIGRIDSEGNFYTVPGTDPLRQWDVNVGPIPEGTYSVDPLQVQAWADLLPSDKAGSWSSPITGPMRNLFGGPPKVGSWPGGPIAWGYFRVQINPQVVINPAAGITRSGFFIHGGLTPGSAGCVDLTGCNNIFFKSFSKQTSPVPFIVQYPGQKQ